MPGFNQVPFYQQLLVYTLLALAGLAITYLLFWKFRNFSYKNLPSHTKRFLIFIGIIAMGAFIYFIPKLSTVDTDGKANLELEDKFRKTYAQVIGGLVLAIGAWLTHRRVKATEEQVKNSQEQVKTMQQGNRSEAFKDAIELLGHKEQDVRIGAIYALEQLAKEDPKRYQWTVIEILLAGLREKATNKSNDDVLEEYGYRNDLQCIINVLGRINLVDKSKTIFLHEINLTGASFEYHTIENFTFFNCKMECVEFKDGNLKNINFWDCNLQSASFYNSCIMDVSFEDSSLSDVTFDQVKFSNIEILSGAKSLKGARFDHDIKCLLKEYDWFEVKSQ